MSLKDDLKQLKRPLAEILAGPKPTDPLERRVWKTLNYVKNYGANPAKLRAAVARAGRSHDYQTR